MMTQEIGVGLVGYKFMGRAHSNAYRQVAAFFPEVALRPALRAICGRDEAAAAAAAAQFGWQSTETDWRRLVARDDIDLVDISTPGDTHAPIAIAAAEAGKHILCEKPLANTLAEARQMAEAAARAGVVNMVMFNYRRVPAVQLARRLVESGRLGTIYHWRAVYLQDWIMDPNFPLVWRLQKDVAGSGALGDLGAHIVDLARFLVGEIAEVTGLTHTFIKQRPLEASSDSSLGAKAGAGVGEVTVDDAALFLARFQSGALGSFEVTRFAKGRLNGNNFEINGSKGSLRFNLERLNELEVLLEDDQADVAGWRTVNVTSGAHHPYVANWWPAGHIIGYEHTFTHAVLDLLNGIAAGASPAPTFDDGVRCQAVLEAVERSAGSRQWAAPDY
jgi:predicted dehydrogenase